MAIVSPDHDDITEADAEQIFARRGCCFFFTPTFSSSSSNTTTRSTTTTKWWQRIGKSSEIPWWKRSLRIFTKVKEWSGMVAGPRWKIFLRRFKYSRCGGGFGRENKRFQYDPLSYALNFDEGHNHDSDVEIGYRPFSARYAAAPISAKSLSNLSGKDSPPFSPDTE